MRTFAIPSAISTPTMMGSFLLKTQFGRILRMHGKMASNFACSCSCSFTWPYTQLPFRQIYSPNTMLKTPQSSTSASHEKHVMPDDRDEHVACTMRLLRWNVIRVTPCKRCRLAIVRTQAIHKLAVLAKVALSPQRYMHSQHTLNAFSTHCRKRWAGGCRERCNIPDAC